MIEIQRKLLLRVSCQLLRVLRSARVSVGLFIYTIDRVHQYANFTIIGKSNVIYILPLCTMNHVTRIHAQPRDAHRKPEIRTLGMSRYRRCFLLLSYIDVRV
jgi:hypothetical protein